MEERVIELLKAVCDRIFRRIQDPAKTPWPESPEQLREEVRRYE